MEGIELVRQKYKAPDVGFFPAFHPQRFNLSFEAGL